MKEKVLPKLLNLLSPVVHSWALFARQIGVPVICISQIRAANPSTGPSYLYMCLSQALEWWVTNHHNPTYEEIIAILDPKKGQKTPVMNRALAREVRKFMAKQQRGKFKLIRVGHLPSYYYWCLLLHIAIKHPSATSSAQGEWWMWSLVLLCFSFIM